MKYFIFFIFIFITGNNYAQRDDLKEFYYSISDISETKIYKYEDLYSEYHYYWRVTTNPNDNTIKTELFDSNFMLSNIFIEKLDNEGSTLIKYIVFDSEGNQISAKIYKNIVFKWDRKKAYRYTIEDAFYDEIKKFSKIRKPSEVVNITINNKTYDALKVIDTYEYIFSEDNKIERYTSMTFYSPDYGIIENRIYSPNGDIKKMQLSKILSVDEFKKLMESNK